MYYDFSDCIISMAEKFLTSSLFPAIFTPILCPWQILAHDLQPTTQGKGNIYMNRPKFFEVVLFGSFAPHPSPPPADDTQYQLDIF